MGISSGDARRLSLWEYEAILTAHNARFDENGPPVDKPEKETVRKRLAALAADRRFTH